MTGQGEVAKLLVAGPLLHLVYFAPQYLGHTVGQIVELGLVGEHGLELMQLAD